MESLCFGLSLKTADLPFSALTAFNYMIFFRSVISHPVSSLETECGILEVKSFSAVFQVCPGTLCMTFQHTPLSS